MPNQLRYLYLPSIFSILGTAMRLSSSRAFATVVAAGILTGTPGLGSSLGLASSSANNLRVFSYVIIMGLVGIVIYSLFTLIENRFSHWQRVI